MTDTQALCLYHLSRTLEYWHVDMIYTNDDDSIHILMDGQEIYTGPFTTDDLRAAIPPGILLDILA